MLLFDKTSSFDEYPWYAAQIIENGWSLSSLEFGVRKERLPRRAAQRFCSARSALYGASFFVWRKRQRKKATPEFASLPAQNRSATLPPTFFLKPEMPPPAASPNRQSETQEYGDMIHISRQFREICIVSPHSVSSPDVYKEYPYFSEILCCPRISLRNLILASLLQLLRNSNHLED